MIFDCARHGQTELNKTGKVQGSRDVPLNLTGVQQALVLSESLTDNYDVIISSDRKRAFRTARIISKMKKIKLIGSSHLVERDYGDLEGLSWTEIETLYPDLPFVNDGLKKYVNNTETCQGIEPWLSFVSRIKGEISWWCKTSPGKKLLFVMHGGCIRALLQKSKKIPKSLPNCCLLRFSMTSEGPEFVKTLSL